MTTHEPAAPNKPEQVSGAFAELSRDIIHGVEAFLNPEVHKKPKIPAPILQKDAFSDAKEAERDYFMDALSTSVGDDVDSAMTTAEQDWKSAGNARVVVEPWMKRTLGLSDPEQPQSVRGTRREIRLSPEGAERELWLNEIEVPHTVNAADGSSRRTANRVTYFMPYSVREFEAQPSEQQVAAIDLFADYVVGSVAIAESDVNIEQADGSVVPPAYVDSYSGTERSQVLRDLLISRLEQGFGLDNLSTSLGSSREVSDGMAEVPLWFSQQTEAMFGPVDHDRPMTAQVITREAVLDVHNGMTYFLRELLIPTRPQDDDLSLPPDLVRATYLAGEPTIAAR